MLLLWWSIYQANYYVNRFCKANKKNIVNATYDIATLNIAFPTVTNTCIILTMQIVKATNDIATLNIAFATVTNTCINKTMQNC